MTTDQTRLATPRVPDAADAVREAQRRQRDASAPTASVWVNASAGSGKTTVLTARVTRLLLSGVRPEKILCLTYTRAGAAEMANRVTSMLSKWAACDEDTLREDLDRLQNEAPTRQQLTEARRLFARVLACPGGLRIRTIHSFCQEILSRFPLEAGLPPHFSLIDEQELETLNNDVLDELLREIGDDPDHALAPALSHLVASQGESGFAEMLSEIMHARGRLSAAIAGHGGIPALVKRLRRRLDLDADDTPQNLRRAALNRIPENDLRTIAPLWAKAGKRLAPRGVALSLFLQASPEEREASFATYASFFLTAKNEPYSSGFVATKEMRAAYPDIDRIAGQEAARLISTLERIEAAEIAETTAGVLAFGEAFAARLGVRKAARAALDYDDLILRTEALLRRQGISPWILYKLDNGLDHILVDEAQDTSRLQWSIVEALTEEFFAGQGAQENKNRTLFVVGDEKQSIFSFQNADPEAFLSRRDFFAARLEAAGKTLEKIGLRTSFRSAPAILSTVDCVFASDQNRRGVSPDPVIHTPAPNKDGSAKLGRVEIWPLLRPLSDDEASDGTWALPLGYEEEHDPQAELAQRIARKIKAWIAQSAVLPGTNKPITAGDIMILLRRRGRFADLMVRALKANDVAVTGVDRMQLLAQLPVMDLLAVLRFVLLPEDDLNLAALLRSPLLNVSEDQLMQIAVGRPASLWQAVQAAPDFAAIADYLKARLDEADDRTPFAFLSGLLNVPCPADPRSGRQALWKRLGSEALDPIEELLNKAQAFGRSRTPSLQNFLHWLIQSDSNIKRELDHGNQKDGGQVRIMTVHASKGLEAPIVFLPDTTAVPRATELNKLQWDESGDTPLPLFFRRLPKHGVAQTLRQAARDKQLEEYRRLLYVALTRAEKRLYICGWVGKKQDKTIDDSWYGLTLAALTNAGRDPALPDELDNDPHSAGNPPAEIAIADVLPPQPKAASPLNKPAPAPAVFLPEWATRPIDLPPETRAMKTTRAAQDNASDDPAASPDEAFARGRIIHRLLQSLPALAPEKRAQAAARFLSHPRHGLNAAQRAEITHEVERLLNTPEFQTLFAADSLVEAPLAGRLNGVDVFRQVDRLCLHKDEVWIVDYKTNRPPPVRVEDIPPSYRHQLNDYRRLLSGIYPGKKVRCFLLWTYAPRLMEIDG